MWTQEIVQEMLDMAELKIPYSKIAEILKEKHDIHVTRSMVAGKIWRLRGNK